MSAPRFIFGFTLLEILVVIVIVIMTLTIIPLAFPKLLNNAGMRESSRTLVAELRSSRSRAIAHQTETLITVDIKRHKIIREGTDYPLNNIRDIRFTSIDQESNSDLANILFFPNGSSTGGQFTLVGNNAYHKIDIDWLTGQVQLIQ